MRIPKVLGRKSTLLIAVALTVWLSLLACKVNVHDQKDGGEDKVDIETPIGGMHINEQADVHDTGLTLYPGARPKPKDKDGDSKGANVNISSSFFGVKVVALEYESDDAPDKVLAFYQDQLKKFGHVVQCHTSKHGGDLSMHAGDNSDSTREVRCEGNDSGNVVELKVGTEANQHLVSVEPAGKGSDFALVYVQTRGKEGTI
jgi:hypothetical protein